MASDIERLEYEVQALDPDAMQEFLPFVTVVRQVVAPVQFSDGMVNARVFDLKLRVNGTPLAAPARRIVIANRYKSLRLPRNAVVDLSFKVARLLQGDSTENDNYSATGWVTEGGVSQVAVYLESLSNGIRFYARSRYWDKFVAGIGVGSVISNGLPIKLQREEVISSRLAVEPLLDYAPKPLGRPSEPIEGLDLKTATSVIDDIDKLFGE